MSYRRCGEEFEPIWNAKRERVIAFLEGFGKSFCPFTETDFLGGR